MQTYDALIVGAGMAGVSLAWQLARAGATVLLLERETQPGYHTTGRSAAMFMESYGPPQVRALTRASRAFYLNPPPGLADAPILQARRALFVAPCEQAGQLLALQDALAGAGGPLRCVARDEALAWVPVLRPDWLHAALLDETGYDIDVHALLHAFLRGARGAGTQLRLGETVAAAAHDGQRWQVRLSSGQVLFADAVVNAAGAWVDEVAAQFGARPIGIQPCRRSAFTFRPPDGLDPTHWPMVIDAAESWYLKPDAGQLLGSPANADPVLPHDVQPEELDIALGIHRIQEATTLSIRRPSACWAGLRSFVPDGEIVLGFDAHCPRFFWLAAQGGYGIQSAAGASLLAASLIQHQRLPDALAQQGVDAARVSPNRLR